MVLTILTNPWTLAVAGVLIGVLFMVLFGSRLAAWLRPQQQAPDPQAQTAGPIVAPAPRRSLTGLSWIIATTHRSVSQLIGLIMSFSSLVAIVLSVMSAVAGVAIIAYRAYNSFLFAGIAALLTLILATLIESLSLNALKSIRLANETIAQAEQAHYDQIVKGMEEQFQKDTDDFAQVNQQTLSKDEVKSMKLAASLKKQARRDFEKKRHTLMRQQTRNARRTRNTSIPFAALGVIFSATAGGLFWHTVLTSLELWLNLTIGTMFALVVSITFVQSELYKRIKDDAIAEALRSGEMQSIMLKQQSEEMVLEMVVDTMATVKEDPNTLLEMGTTIKDELKSTIKTLTKQTTSRLVEDDDHPTIIVSEVPPSVLQIEEQTVSKKQKKEPDWCSHPALAGIEKRHLKLHQKLSSWRTAGRFSVTIGTAIETLIETTGQSRKTIQRRIKDGTLEVSRRNPNLVLISSILDWLELVDAAPVVSNEAPITEVSASQNEPITDSIPVISESSSPDEAGIELDESALESSPGWQEILAAAVDALRANPEITEPELGEVLNLQAMGIVRFWKHKAIEVLAKEQSVASHNGHNGRGAGVSLNGFVPLK